MTGFTSKIDTTAIPTAWRSQVESQLAAGERLVAFFEPDLNSQLDFADGLVVLTDRRILTPEGQTARRDWPGRRNKRKLAILANESYFRIASPGGGGLGRCISSAQMRWKRLGGTHRQNRPPPPNLSRRSKAVQRGDADAKDSIKQRRRPHNLSLLRSEARAAANGMRIVHSVGSAATGALLVALGPICPTAGRDDWPGIRPHACQHDGWPGAAVPHDPVDEKRAYSAAARACLSISELCRGTSSALFGAAILAWMLSWAKSYVLARVSEQVSADLRNETYAHLQRLSLEFFGGKRTGDLISRVGSDTDRICTFPLGEFGRFRQRHADDRVDGRGFVLHRPGAGIGHAIAVSFDRLAGAACSNPLAPWVCSGKFRLGGNDQRVGRHDSGNSRGESVRAGAPRNRPVSAAKSARAGRQ